MQKENIEDFLRFYLGSVENLGEVSFPMIPRPQEPLKERVNQFDLEKNKILEQVKELEKVNNAITTLKEGLEKGLNEAQGKTGSRASPMFISRGLIENVGETMSYVHMTLVCMVGCEHALQAEPIANWLCHKTKSWNRLWFAVLIAVVNATWQNRNNINISFTRGRIDPDAVWENANLKMLGRKKVLLCCLSGKAIPFFDWH
ncbi:hypothetical protein VNO78_03907 [Psophocarpus tetragonolobus]|uniref:Uncharacterized protein n=1 Tax=Psophocarpus tetragonolobus TaxID=3891 RepID=A0AAN9T1B7_PSOTE